MVPDNSHWFGETSHVQLTALMRNASVRLLEWWVSRTFQDFVLFLESKQALLALLVSCRLETDCPSRLEGETITEIR
jgi:hypothetical protein